VRRSPRQTSIIHGKRVNVNGDVWNVPGHALAYVRVEKERKIYKFENYAPTAERN